MVAFQPPVYDRKAWMTGGSRGGKPLGPIKASSRPFTNTIQVLGGFFKVNRFVLITTFAHLWMNISVGVSECCAFVCGSVCPHVFECDCVEEGGGVV